MRLDGKLVQAVGVVVAGLLLAAPNHAKADDLECVSTTFRMLSPSDKVCLSVFDDPKVPGVTCYISQARTGGWGQPLGLNEDPSNFSVSCRQMGPIDVDLKTCPIARRRSPRRRRSSSRRRASIGSPTSNATR